MNVVWYFFMAYTMGQFSEFILSILPRRGFLRWLGYFGYYSVCLSIGILIFAKLGIK